MILVADEQVAQDARTAGQLACPACGGRLRKHGFARPRSVRTHGGGHRALRPARVRCAEPACGRTRVLLPAWCVPGRSVDADTIGAALLAAAHGAGHRPIADRLGIPADTVRGWLRAARDNSRWLYKTAAIALHNAVREDPALPPPNRSALWHAVEALGAAAAAMRRMFGTSLRTTAWPLIVLITAGRLLRPLPARSG